MSMINIISSFSTPSYPMLFMIESETMKEARKRDGIFEGTVGELRELSTGDGATTANRFKGTIGEPYSASGPGAEPHIKFKINDEAHIDESDGMGSGGWFLNALEYIFKHFISEQFRKEIIIARAIWQTPGGILDSNVRRTFNRAHGDRSKIMFSPFGCPFLRERKVRDIFMAVIADILLAISLSVPYIATYYLTGYKSGKSTAFQRALFMMWLVFGQVSYSFHRTFWVYWQARVVRLGLRSRWGFFVVAAIPSALFALVPAGGILMAANMYRLDLLKEASASTGSINATSAARLLA